MVAAGRESLQRAQTLVFGVGGVVTPEIEGERLISRVLGGCYESPLGYSFFYPLVSAI